MRDKADILIRAERTPNPLALKLVMNFLVKRKGAASFSAKEGAGPFFGKLFEISGLVRIYIFENQITLTFENEPSLEGIEKQAEALIKENYSLHDPDFEAAKEETAKKPAAPSPAIQKIEEILDRTIRPGLKADGGDIEVISLRENKLEISYQGACGGCPSSYMGTLEAIENILRYELNNKDLWVCPIS